MSTPETVRLADMHRTSGLLRANRKPTTAHAEIVRFYRKVLTPGRKPSYVERIAQAPSVFAVAGLVEDFRSFATADAKAHERIERAAYARMCELRGVLP